MLPCDAKVSSSPRFERPNQTHEVNREMRSVGNQVPVGRKDGAAEVESLCSP